jgi:alkylation response protein AidB-like acyl-CoA dehydrogenase
VSTIAVNGHAIDARGYRRALTLDGTTVSAVDVGAARDAVDLTRAAADVSGTATAVGDLDSDAVQRWLALALATTSADLVGTARGAHTLACDYAKIREQYGKSIGSYQAIAHLLAESLALIEGSVSILRHAAWAVDELDPAEAIRAGRFAKVYCARAARTVCETAIQVHGGIGNTWECLAHVYLRRALTSTQLWPVKLEEISVGLP